MGQGRQRKHLGATKGKTLCDVGTVTRNCVQALRYAQIVMQIKTSPMAIGMNRCRSLCAAPNLRDDVSAMRVQREMILPTMPRSMIAQFAPSEAVGVATGETVAGATMRHRAILMSGTTEAVMTTTMTTTKAPPLKSMRLSAVGNMQGDLRVVGATDAASEMSEMSVMSGPAAAAAPTTITRTNARIV